MKVYSLMDPPKPSKPKSIGPSKSDTDQDGSSTQTTTVSSSGTSKCLRCIRILFTGGSLSSMYLVTHLVEMILILFVARHAISRSYSIATTSHNLSREFELEKKLEELDVQRADLLLELAKSHRLHLNEEAAKEADEKLLGSSKFKVGNVIEQIYNSSSRKSRVLFPYRVTEIHFDQEADDEMDDSDLKDEDCGGIRYTIVRLSDGFKIERAPESFLREYLPYPQDARGVLCDVGGEVGIMAEQLIIPCSVQEYIMNEEMSLEKAMYRVRLSGSGEGEDEVEQILSMEKLQRFA